MKTHKVQIVSHRRLLASLLLVIAVATWGTQVAESAERRRRWSVDQKLAIVAESILCAT